LESGSCALDCVLKAADLLGVFRVQFDQLDRRTEIQLSMAAKVLRYIMLRPWATISTTQRSTMRNCLREALNRIDPKLFPPGQWMNAGDVLECLFQGVRQVAYTLTIGKACCDMHVAIPKQRKVKRRVSTMLSFTGSSIEEKLNSYFAAYAVESAHRPCTNGDTCLRQVRRQRVVLEQQLPPVLVVIWAAQAHKGTTDALGLERPLSLKYRSRAGVVDSRYHLFGCIFFTAGNHYTLKWRSFETEEGRLIVYDGYCGEKMKVQSSDKWWEGMDTSRDVPGVMFYRLEK